MSEALPAPRAIVVETASVVALTTYDFLSDLGFDVAIDGSVASVAAALFAQGADVALLVAAVRMKERANDCAVLRRIARSHTSLAILITSAHWRPAPAELPHDALCILKPYLTSQVTSYLRRLLSLKRPGLLTSGRLSF